MGQISEGAIFVLPVFGLATLSFGRTIDSLEKSDVSSHVLGSHSWKSPERSPIEELLPMIHQSSL